MQVDRVSEKLRAKCEREARLSGARWCVVRMDCQDSYRLYVVSEDYTLDPEFEAFAGQILYVSGE